MKVTSLSIDRAIYSLGSKFVSENDFSMGIEAKLERLAANNKNAAWTLRRSD